MRSLPRRLLALLFVPSLLLFGCGEEPERLDPERYPIIPLPADADAKRGEFTLDGETQIVVDPWGAGGGIHKMLVDWVTPLREATGFPLPVVSVDEARGGNEIVILHPSFDGNGLPESASSRRRSDTRQAKLRLFFWNVRDLLGMKQPRGQRNGPGRSAGLGPAPAPGEGFPGTAFEAYTLEVTPGEVRLEADGWAGVYYGLNTLSQLIPGMNGSRDARLTDDRVEAAGLGSEWSVPAVEIEDEPRFAYRGMHLDVGRHFFPPEFIKRYIDVLAQYRMNVFHWHLTEDQGWRLEIEGYPRLTEVGSCRSETIVEKNFDPYVGDGTPYCGFYTQEEAREIVRYAAERFITVMPEIEMPGHSVAALAAYPELACTPGPFQVSTRWGVTRDIFCPREETFDFLGEVLTQVMGIFPSPYIHIGGDEAPKLRWEESELAQEVISREGLADEAELQSWFIRRIEAFLNANGRKLVGWDEILEGGLAPNATVMSWRGEAGGIAAAREGHDVIMTPNSHLYLDFYQGDTIQEPLAIGGFSPLEKVYSYEPIPEVLEPDEARHVLGAQGNVWTEYMATTDYVEYMVLPRLLALSEVDWSPAELKDWDHFTRRLPNHLGRLDEEGYDFRIPDVTGLERDRKTLEPTVEVDLRAPVPGGTVLYTTDGSEPEPGASRLDHPLIVPVDSVGWEIAARARLPDGRMGAVRRARFERTTLAPPLALPHGERAPGLAVELVPGRFRSVQEVAPAADGRGPSGGGSAPGAQEDGIAVPRVILPDRIPSNPFGLELTGFIRVPRNGIYTFYLSSDDGSHLTVAGREVVNHDGPHSMAEKSAEVALRRGWHPIRVLYFQAGGGAGLELEVEGPGVPRREVPAGWLAHLRAPEGDAAGGAAGTNRDGPTP